MRWYGSCHAVRAGGAAMKQSSLSLSVTDADVKLLNLILYSKHHVLHSRPILPDRSDFNYNLRPTAKSSSITDREYITRMILKNIY